MRITEYAWEDFVELTLKQKVHLLAQRDGTPFHTLFSQQFKRETLDELGFLATEIRTIAKSRTGMQFLQSMLSHKRAMLYFSQPSSRTFLSFLSACQILGLRTGAVRDSATSSEYKGESREDSVRTFSSYFDLIIMRTREKGLAEHMAWVLSNTERPIPIINAGSGQDQHPTQALLDIYTLQRSFERRGGLRDRTVVFVGDLARGRTVRSLSALLQQYNNIKQVFIAPEALQIKQDVLDSLAAAGVEYSLSDNLAEALPHADAVYMTRIQDEWDRSQGESAQIDTSQFHITAEEMKLMRADAVLMHPFPRRDEISPEVDRDPRSVYWRQMRNGMWIRAALIATTFGYGRRIHEYFRENL